MLDDLKYIHQKDSLDLLGHAARQINQLQPAGKLSRPAKSYAHAIWCTSSEGRVAGELLRQWPGLTVPFEIADYESLPAYVGKQTLVLFLMDGSAAARATLGRAEATGATIVLIDSPDHLQQSVGPNVSTMAFNKTGNWFTVLQLWATLTDVMEAFGLTADSSASTQLAQLHTFLQPQTDQWAPAVPTNKNIAKQLALELIGRSIVLHAGPLLYPAVLSWKSAINRTAQTVAWTSRFPDFLPNELLGWSSHPLEKSYASILLHSSYDSANIRQLFQSSERSLSGRWPTPEQITAAGTSKAEQLAWSVILGDFVSIYIALLNGKNPGKDSQTILRRMTAK